MGVCCWGASAAGGFAWGQRPAQVGLSGGVGPGQCPCVRGDIICSPPVFLEGLGLPATEEVAGGAAARLASSLALRVLRCSPSSWPFCCTAAVQVKGHLCDQDGWDGSHQTQGQAWQHFPQASSPPCLMAPRHRDC